jgi:phage FluMu protein Com
MSSVTFSPKPVRVRRTCESCHRALELECEGIAGMAGYEAYSEYVCPRCRKLSRALTPGRIISARPLELTPDT